MGDMTPLVQDGLLHMHEELAGANVPQSGQNKIMLHVFQHHQAEDSHFCHSNARQSQRERFYIFSSHLRADQMKST